MKRFVVLAHARSGSNLLSTAMIAHPHIRMFGELFNHDEQGRRQGYQQGLLGMFTSTHLQSFMLRQQDGAVQRYDDLISRVYDGQIDPIPFIEKNVWYDYGLDMDFAVGFKLLFDQAMYAPANRIWSYLRAHNDIHIIHLYRENLLEAYVSLMTAARTQTWLVWQGSQRREHSDPRITIDPVACRNFITYTEQRIVWAKQAFAYHPSLSFVYEPDLVGRFSCSMESVQNFLDIQVQPLTPLLEKQAMTPLQDRVANYAELKNSFRGTPHERWFHV